MNKKVFISIVVAFAIIFLVLIFFFISDHEADIVTSEFHASLPTDTPLTNRTTIPPELETQRAYYRQTQQELEFLSSATLQAAETQAKVQLTQLALGIKPTITSYLPNPTDYPPVKATVLAGMQQTQQAAALIPTRDLQEDYPLLPIEPKVEDILAVGWTGTLAGYGILTEIEPPSLWWVAGNTTRMI